MHARARMTARAAGLFALVVGLWLALLAPTAAAHALLIRADPAINGTVTSSPQRILLTFTEPVDPSLSGAQVVNTQGQPVPGALPSRAVPSNSEQLAIRLSRPLPLGVYTVDWHTVSALDGHYVTGAYAFGVGVANIGKVAPFGKFVSTSHWLTGAQSVGRWLLWAGLVVLLGCACTCWFVWRGTLPARGSSLLWAGWVAAAVGVSTYIVTERTIVRAPSLLPLFGTPEGLVMVAQLTAVLVLCGLAVAATAALPCRPTLAVLGGAAAFATMTVIWETHANGPSPYRFFNLTVQWLHVMGVGVWVGGLAWLLIGLRGLPGPERATAGRRFSVVATIGLAVVALTGLSRAAAEVGAPADLLHTSFGRLLLLKLALFVGLVVLGARNRFVEVPALAKDDALPPFRRTLRGEVVLGVAILAVTGVLGGVATGREAATAARASAASRVVLSGSDYATTVRVRLVVDPGTVGSNRFTATVSDYATGRPLAGVRAVQLDFSLPAQTTVPASTLALSKGPGGVWAGSGFELSVKGRWQIEVLVEGAASAVQVPLAINATVTAR